MKNAKFRKDGKNALVAKTSLAYGLSRVFQVGSDLQGVDKIEVFKGHQLQQALQWLDLEHMAKTLEATIAQCEQENQ